MNSKRQTSTRFITVISIVENDGLEAESFYAFCKKRKSTRQFRFDRIKNVYDEDGVACDPEDFFLEYDIYVPEFVMPKKKTSRRSRRRERERKRAEEYKPVEYNSSDLDENEAYDSDVGFGAFIKKHQISLLVWAFILHLFFLH